MSIRRTLSAFAYAALLLSAGATLADEARTNHEKQFDEAFVAAKALLMTNPERTLKENDAIQLLALDEPVKSKRILESASADWLLAESLIRIGRSKDALIVLDRAKKSIRDIPISKLNGDILRSRGNAYLSAGNIQIALTDLMAAHDAYLSVHESRGQAMALMNIGTIYQEAGDFNKVLQYYDQAEEIPNKDREIIISLKNNRGLAFSSLGQYQKAKSLFIEAKSIAISMNSKLLELNMIENIASTEIKKNDLKSAENYVFMGLDTSKFSRSARKNQYLIALLAEIRFRQGNHTEAVSLIEKAFAGQDLTKTLPAYAEIHKYAVDIYSAAGNDRLALQHLKAYKRIDDETRALAADTNAALMAAKFDFANQDLKIANLKAGQLQRDIKLARFRSMITTVLLAGLAIIAGLLLVGLVSLRRSRDQVRAANVNLNSVNTSLEKALKAKTEFLATTSHEVRTPLNGILGMTQVILADRRVDPTMRDRISIVHGAAETMRALVDDILDVAKMENGNLDVVREEIDLVRILEETAQMWREKAATKALGFRLDIAEAPRRIVEDGSRLRQVLFNLLSNAIKFTDAGEVGLTARVIEKDGGEHLALSVTDTGIGIPADQFEDVFVSFKQLDGGTTRQHGGTGLGLTICRNLATAMNGEITLESTVGEGSVFNVLLPLTRAEAPSEVESLPDYDGGPVAGRSLADSAVLLVEGNPLAQSMMKAALTPHVRVLEVVGSGALALTALEHRNFDQILVEGAAAQLPDLEKLPSILALVSAARQSPVSVLWSQPTEADTAALLSLGVVQVFAKPMSPQAIVDGLKDSCEKLLGNAEAQPGIKSALTA